jgi:RHS repeat-associated protein
MLTEIKTGTIQHLDYSFNPQTGNLIARKDKIHNLNELFEYDNLGRLTTVNGPAPINLTYSANGNILSKTSIGNYTYGTKPHAISSVTNPSALIDTARQSISYTTANKVDSIVQGIFAYKLSYGQADQRTVSRSYESSTLKNTIWYDGAYEKDSTAGRVRQLHYISGGAGLAAIFVRTNNVDTMYYVHTDHLGSFDLITSSTGAVKDRYSFDAWGRRRNPLNWTYTSVPVNYLFNRGYTGHEHLDQFKLINMNGRVYDPLLGRFLSPDKYVQGADFTQGYNRYSYVQNNPMNRVDPSGWKMVPYKGPWVNYNGMYARSAYFTMHFRPFLYDVTIGPESGLDTWAPDDGTGSPGGGGGGGRGLNTSGVYTNWGSYIVCHVYPKALDRKRYNYRNGVVVSEDWISQEDIDVQIAKNQAPARQIQLFVTAADILSRLKKERGYGLGIGNSPSVGFLKSLLYRNTFWQQGPITKTGGGFIYDYNTFITFMKEKANNESVEVAAFQIYDQNTHSVVYWIQPWFENSSKHSNNYWEKIPAPYKPIDVLAQYHTHLSYNGLSWNDAWLSCRSQIDVFAIHPDGSMLHADYCGQYYELPPIYPVGMDY